MTQRRYRIGDVIGVGGYGKAYRAVDLTRGVEVCLKYTYDQVSWQREAYFGELFRGHSRVIQVYDSFPVLPRSGRGRIRYCLVLELAEHGTLSDYQERTGKPWSEERAVREIKGILRVLDQLHGGSATHRDITPYNIFVTKNGVLKLGDFGIARHELAGHPLKPEAFNPDYVTRGIIDAEHRAWQPVDDVFQMGQLLAMLVLGQHREKITVAKLKKKRISPGLKALIKRAIGPRSQRYRDAWEMLLALREAPPLAPSPLDTLHGRTIVFSGILSMPRADAEALATAAGAKVARRVSKAVDVLVRGKPARRGVGSRPHAVLAAQRLLRQGHPIHLIDEAALLHLIRGAQPELTRGLEPAGRRATPSARARD